jgi:hypothetical protein
MLWFRAPLPFVGGQGFVDAGAVPVEQPNGRLADSRATPRPRIRRVIQPVLYVAPVVGYISAGFANRWIAEGRVLDSAQLLSQLAATHTGQHRDGVPPLLRARRSSGGAGGAVPDGISHGSMTTVSRHWIHVPDRPGRDVAYGRESPVEVSMIGGRRWVVVTCSEACAGGCRLA